MLFLAIDTAGSACAVALARREEGGMTALLAARSEEIGRGHSERLMPVIEQALADAGAKLRAIEGVAVTIGPGSFVGVRVGIAAARGLALALGIPAAGIGSLDALILAAARGRKDGTAVAAIDARRGEVYAMARDIASDAIRVEAGLFTLDDLAMRLGGAALPLLAAGSAASALAAEAGGVQVVARADHPEIADVAELAFRGGEAVSPAPLYLRGADATPQSRAIARQ